MVQITASTSLPEVPAGVFGIDNGGGAWWTSRDGKNGPFGVRPPVTCAVGAALSSDGLHGGRNKKPVI